MIKFKILLLLFIVLFSTVNSGELIEFETVDNPPSTNTMAKVYVNEPNFIVLDENSYDTLTVIKDAKIPSSYDGTLIRLKTDDLSDLKKVLQNLNTKKLIFYAKDIKLAVNLEDELEVLVI
ncbi:MAG: hypothetical protein ABIC04_07800 [Nanoarchaeota archaeon]